MLVSTMSTSNRTQSSPGVSESDSWAGNLPGSDGLPSGILSPAELARMANELFSALPDGLQQPAVTAARMLPLPGILLPRCLVQLRPLCQGHLHPSLRSNRGHLLPHRIGALRRMRGRLRPRFQQFRVAEVRPEPHRSSASFKTLGRSLLRLRRSQRLQVLPRRLAEVRFPAKKALHRFPLHC
jgi:hypothetical protein